MNLHGLLTGAFEIIAHTVKFVSSPLIAEDLYGGLKLGLQAKTCFMVSDPFKAHPPPPHPRHWPQSPPHHLVNGDLVKDFLSLHELPL